MAAKKAIVAVGCAAHKRMPVGICVILIGWHTIAPAGSERQPSTPSKGQREAQQHSPDPEADDQKTNDKRKRRDCARTHVADGE